MCKDYAKLYNDTYRSNPNSDFSGVEFNDDMLEFHVRSRSYLSDHALPLGEGDARKEYMMQFLADNAFDSANGKDFLLKMRDEGIFIKVVMTVGNSCYWYCIFNAYSVYERVK